MANKIVREIIHAKGIDIGIYTKDFENEYISLTDIAKYRNDNDPRFVIQNWMRNRNTVEFLAVWEELHNPDFNRVQFEAVRSEAGKANGIAKYLENHGIHKIARQNGKNPLFDAALIRRIIQNPFYSGKISYGRRRTEKVHGTRNEYRQVKKDDYLLVDGLHEALVSEEVWEQAQVKVAAQAKKYEKVNRDKREKIHLLSGILKCPVCGA